MKVGPKYFGGSTRLKGLGDKLFRYLVPFSEVMAILAAAALGLMAIGLGTWGYFFDQGLPVTIPEKPGIPEHVTVLHVSPVLAAFFTIAGFIIILALFIRMLRQLDARRPTKGRPQTVAVQDKIKSAFFKSLAASSLNPAQREKDEHG